MITAAPITQRAAADDVNARTVERDYVLAHIIAGFAALGNDTGLVFKGGTALRLCYFEDYRYSADLDFSVVAGTEADAYATIVSALDNAGAVIPGMHLTDSMPPRIAYVGPLGRERNLKLDIATDELVLNTGEQGLLPRWPDLPNDANVFVYTLPEIAGEKIRCILQRLQCRDLFDLSLLLEAGYVDPTEAAQIFVPKAEHRNLDPAAFPERYAQRINQYRERWGAELREHVAGDVPHFDRIERHVTRSLRGAGLL
jgi:hypothetical protein